MNTIYKIIFARSIKLQAKKRALRMRAFLAVRDNPIRPKGCYGWLVGGRLFGR
jgi:hypothetical protein